MLEQLCNQYLLACMKASQRHIFRHLVSGVWCQASGVRRLVASIWRQAANWEYNYVTWFFYFSGPNFLIIIEHGSGKYVRLSAHVINHLASFSLAY